MIAHNKPNLSHQEVDAAVEVIKSCWLTQGKQVKKLEEHLARFLNRKFCVAVSSGTMALSLALKALKIKSGDEVIIPSYTCSALYHAVKFNNATPVYADIEEETCNLSPDSVKQNMTPKSKAIIFPHMFGQPGHIEEVKKLGLPVVEDIAQAVGAKINNKPAGYFGDISVISFYATKMLGAGEGGAVLTDAGNTDNYIRDIRAYDETDTLKLRYNAKMTDITAAIALEQLKKLPAFIEQRRAIFQLYEYQLNKSIELPVASQQFFPNYYRLIIDRREADHFLHFGVENNVQFRKPVYQPLHLYQKQESLPVTEKKWQQQVSVPIYPKLTPAEIDTILQIIDNYDQINQSK